MSTSPKVATVKVEDTVLSASSNLTPSAPERDAHSSQGGGHGPSKGVGPLGTWLVIAVLTLAIFMMWFLVLGILEARN